MLENSSSASIRILLTINEWLKEDRHHNEGSSSKSCRVIKVGLNTLFQSLLLPHPFLRTHTHAIQLLLSFRNTTEFNLFPGVKIRKLIVWAFFHDVLIKNERKWGLRKGSRCASMWSIQKLKGSEFYSREMSFTALSSKNKTAFYTIKSSIPSFS